MLDVPFSGHVGIIAGILHHLNPHFAVFDGRKVLLLFALAGLPQITPGHQHRTTCNTHGPVPATHIVGIRKRGSVGDKPVEVRCFQLRISQARHSVEGHVVDKKKKHIRLFSTGRLLRLRRCRGDCSRCHQGRRHQKAG